MSNVSENPVGDDEPTFRFPYKTWQVLAGLFVVAILVTAWQWYAQNYVAPATPIRWQDFSLAETVELRRQRKTLLIWVQPASPQLLESTQEMLRQPEVQAAAWRRKLSARHITSDHAGDDEVETWLGDIHNELAGGGFVLQEPGDNRPQWLLQRDATRQSLANLINGEE